MCPLDMCGDMFEKILTDAHDAEMTMDDVTPAIVGASTHRQALGPYFNELTCNLDRIKDVKLSKKAEAALRELIDETQRSLGEMNLHSTSPAGIDSSSMDQSSNKRGYVSITNYKYDGNGRVKTAKNSQW